MAIIAAQRFNTLDSSDTFTTDTFPTGSMREQLTNLSSFLASTDPLNLGFLTLFTDSRGNEGPLQGGESGDFIGANGFSGSNAPDVAPDGTAVAAGVEQNFQFNDTDGLLELEFDPVDLSGMTGRTLTFSYWINDTGYESDDAFTVAFSGNGLVQPVLNFGEADLEANAAADDGTANWATVSFDLEPIIASGLGETLTLSIGVDTNAGSENIFIDDVEFAGDAMGSDPDPVLQIVESFEFAPGDTYTIEDAFDDGGFDYLGRYIAPDNSNGGRDDFQSGFDGAFAIQAQDLDGEGGDATRTVTIPDLDISAMAAPTVTLSLGALNSSGFDNYEAADGDGVRIFATVDGGARTLIGAFLPVAVGDGGTAGAGNLALDTDGDGVGDGDVLTTELSAFTFDLPAEGTTATIEIDLTSTGSFEPLALDNVIVQSNASFQESFEELPGATYTLTGAFDDGGFDFFDRFAAPDTTNGARDDFPDGFDGDFAIFGQDIDGDGGPSTGVITIADIDISQIFEPEIGISLAALNSEPNFFNFEAADGDGIRIFATVDGGARTLIGQFSPPASGAGDLYADLDFDGVGEGDQLTTQLDQFIFLPPEAGASLTLEIEVTSTDSFEPVAIDNVVVATGLSSVIDLGDPQVLQIGAIQGMTDTSPFDGVFVQTSGVVTAVDTNGFYIQDVDGDGDAATSDGIFVSSSDGVDVGDLVTVTGIAEERFVANRALTVTQIDAFTVVSDASGQALPAPVVIGAGDLPTDNGNGGIPGAIQALEALEGMLVTATGFAAVAARDGGEVYGVLDEGVGATGFSDRGTLNIGPGDFSPEKLQIDNGLGILVPDAGTGDIIGDVTGILSYDGDSYEIQLTEAAAVTTARGLAPQTTSLAGTASQMTVATYNVLNLDPNDSDGDTDVADGRFDAIAAQIVGNLAAPDVIGLQEIQDNTGSVENDGVTSASQTLQDLVDAIADAGGPTYEWIDNTFIIEGASGGQPGSNIRTAYLYNPARVDLVEGSVRPVDSQAPGGIYEGGRLPLAADFTFNGEVVTVVNNHFSSKGGSAPIYGTAQPFGDLQEDPGVNGSLDERQAQSDGVQDFVNAIYADRGADANVVVLGDLNEFEFVSPVLELETDAGLVNLTNDIQEDERYTFIFQGNSQSLDHILVSDSLAAGAEVDIVHTNVEFPDTDARASDHEPIVARLDLGASVNPGPFVLELLHFTDQEANAATIDNIDNLSAVLNALRNEDLGNDGLADNTLTVSSGDVIIPGLFFDASEAVFGSAGIADIQIQNELGLQAAALGNHEFDLGTGFLAGLIDGTAPGDFSALSGTALDGQDYQGALFPYLSANLGFDTDPNLAPIAVAGGQDTASLTNVVTSSSVSDVNGELVGIVGATVPTIDSISSAGPDIGIFPEDFDSNPTDAQLDALAAVLQAEVDALLADNAGLDKVVLLSHMQQISIELALAERLEGVDIIVAGGSNTRLFDDEDRPRDGDSDQGQYPIFVTNAGGSQTAVVNTDANYKYVGRLVIEFDDDGNIVPGSYDDTVSGAYATDDAGVAALGAEGLVDPEIDAITDAIQDQIIATESNVFGVSDVFLNGNRSGLFSSDDPDGVRTQETNLGNLTADANLVYANQIIEEQDLGDPVLISIKNGGGIRANIGQIVVPAGGTEAQRVPNEEIIDAAGNVVKPSGGISQNDIQTVLAFNNGLTLLDITKTELKAFLEGAVAALPDGVSGGFPQISGLKFSFDENATAQTYNPDGTIAIDGERVLNAGIFDGDKLIAEIVRDGEIVGNPDESFRIVTLNFLANAGDEILSTLSNPNRVDLIDLDADGVDDGIATGAATFADDGSEQDALAEYLNDNFNPANGGLAYAEVDTGPELDERIQNVSFREDTVLAPTIFDIAAENDSFDILEAALLATGLDGVVDDATGLFTVFAPTDDAFTQLTEDLGVDTTGLDEPGITAALLGALEDLGGSPEAGLDLLSNVLLYHVAPGAQTLGDLQATGTIDTALEDASFTVDGTTLVDNEPDIEDPSFIEGLTDIEAANGIIQAIDRVLLPIDIEGGAPGLNLVEGSEGSDILKGTDEADLFVSRGGRFDELFGFEGADVFYFGDEATDRHFDRDTIFGFEAGTDTIALAPGVGVQRIWEVGPVVIVTLDGPRKQGDTIVLFGDDLDTNSVADSIVNDFLLDDQFFM